MESSKVTIEIEYDGLDFNISIKNPSGKKSQEFLAALQMVSIFGERLKTQDKKKEEE